jgi:hypothetical protein
VIGPPVCKLTAQPPQLAPKEADALLLINLLLAGIVDQEEVSEARPPPSGEEMLGQASQYE